MPRLQILFGHHVLWASLGLFYCASCADRDENAQAGNPPEVGGPTVRHEGSSPSALNPVGKSDPAVTSDPNLPSVADQPLTAGSPSGGGIAAADPESRPPDPVPTPTPGLVPDATPPAKTEGIKDFKTWRGRFEAVTDPKERLEFFAHTSGNNPPYFPKMVRIALADDAAPIRAEAMQSTSMLSQTERVPLLVEIASSNENETLRSYAMDDIFVLRPAVKSAIYHQLLDAEYPDVREKAANKLANFSTPETFELLLDGLASSAAEQREHVSGLVQQMVGKRFDDRDSAATWWAQNRERFDDTMSPD